jgi:hypothetical protein
MNLFEMLIFMLLSAVLLGLGWLLSLKWGTVGFLITAVPVAMSWAVVLFFVPALIQEVKWSWTSRPCCRNNKCGKKRHVLVSATAEQAVFRCKCGDQYLSKAGHFSQVLHGGALLPYMMRDALGDRKADRGRVRTG